MTLGGQVGMSSKTISNKNVEFTRVWVDRRFPGNKLFIFSPHMGFDAQKQTFLEELLRPKNYQHVCCLLKVYLLQINREQHVGLQHS